MRLQFLAAAVLATCVFVERAQAHGGVSIDQGQCIMKIGPDTMTFTGYQPQKSREQFCDDIPDAGPTIVVLDAQQDELRDMALDIRVLRNVGQTDDKENLEANTEVYVAPRKYKTGTLNFEYNFKNKGNFIGLVTAKSDDGSKVYVSRFPFAVGETATKDMTIYAFFSVCGIVAFGLWYRGALSKGKQKDAAAAVVAGSRESS